jgi:hypothetical protein
MRDGDIRYIFCIWLVSVNNSIYSVMLFNGYFNYYYSQVLKVLAEGRFYTKTPLLSY